MKNSFYIAGLSSFVCLFGGAIAHAEKQDLVALQKMPIQSAVSENKQLQAKIASTPTTTVSVKPKSLLIKSDDIFAGEKNLTTTALRAKSGGTATSIDLTNLGINHSETVGVVSNSSADGAISGAITGNTVADNNGFTTVFINSGNNVVFQNTLQVNVFTDGN